MALRIPWFILLATVIIFGVYTRKYDLISQGVIWLVLSLAIGPYFRWAISRRLRKAPTYNSRYRFQLTPDGITVQSDKIATQMSWDAYTRAIRLKDGFLLFQGPHLINWLRFDGIVEGSVEDADQLLRDNMAEYKSD